ncbi:hypothetical protein AAY473_007596 [Plecturocebus cupreus]
MVFQPDLLLWPGVLNMRSTLFTFHEYNAVPLIIVAQLHRFTAGLQSCSCITEILCPLISNSLFLPSLDPSDQLLSSRVPPASACQVAGTTVSETPEVTSLRVF